MDPSPDLESIVRRFAEPRESAIKLLASCERAQGHPFGSEMREWIHLFEKYELEVCDPAGAELRMPSLAPTLRTLIEQHGPSWIADLIGFLTASTVVIQQDEMSYLASWHSGESGRSKVFYFHPHDWGLWPTDRSLLERIAKLMQDNLQLSDDRSQLPPHVDPSALFRRVDWLVHVLLGVGRELARELERAATPEEWRAEKKLLAGAPHLSTYWLWSHYFFDDHDGVDELLELTADETNGVFADAREIVVALVDDKPVKLGEDTHLSFREKKKRIEALAPIDFFSKSALARRKKRLEEAEDSSGEKAALAELTARARNEPRIAEALRLLEHLARGGANRPEPTEAVPLDVDRAMARLAELVDRRFRPLIEVRLRRAALFPDVHQEASWGLLLAWSQLADDLTEFEATLEKIGTKNFGPRRSTELYRAYANFSDRRATEVLALGAKYWLDEVEDWIRMTPAEPVLRLLERDCLETHQMMGAILERASFSGANWDVAVKVARAAGELRSSRAIKGLERAVEQQLGRIEDGTRAEVARSLFLAAGAGSRSFFEKQAEKKIAAIRYADPPDAPLLEKDLACLYSGLLAAAPDDEHVSRHAAELLDRLRASFETARPHQIDGLLAAMEAIIRGAMLGEVRALAPAIFRVASIRPSDRSPRKAQISRLIELADTAARDVGS